MIEEIAENIYLVKGKNKGFFPFSNSVLITPKGQDMTLIDTGCGIEILEELKKKFKIGSVINSHTHPDHSAGNWLFTNDGVSITVPKEGFGEAGNIFKLSERLAEPGELAKYWREWVTATMDFKDVQIDDWFDSGSTLEIGDLTLRPIYTPGHTVDHYCLYESKNKILFGFDYDLTRFGPWYGHRESSISEFKDSIKRIMELEIDIFVSGHKGVITENIKGRLEEFLKKFDHNEEKILALLAEGEKSIEDLTELAPIYGAFPYAEPLLRYWEGNMIRKHLDEMVEVGRVARGNNGLYSAL